MDSNQDPDLLREKARLAWLKSVVDMVASVLAQQSDLRVDDALRLMEAARSAVLRQFPDKEALYDMIYTSRFTRILKERFGDDISTGNGMTP